MPTTRQCCPFICIAFHSSRLLILLHFPLLLIACTIKIPEAMIIPLAGIALQIVMMVIIICVFLLFVLITTLILTYICRPSARRREGQDCGHGLASGDIEKLPCYDYAARDKAGESAAECAVCLDAFRAGEKCRMLPECKHRFHAHCVDSWLLKAAVCPICRTSAKKRDGGEKDGMELQETGDQSVKVQVHASSSG